MSNQANSTMDLIHDRFAFGWHYTAEGRTLLDGDPEMDSTWPIAHDDDGEPIYGPLSPAVGKPTVVCPRCMTPTWHISRHAAEVHGDPDVAVTAPLPGRKPPEWFHPDWV